MHQYFREYEKCTNIVICFQSAKYQFSSISRALTSFLLADFNIKNAIIVDRIVAITRPQQVVEVQSPPTAGATEGRSIPIFCLRPSSRSMKFIFLVSLGGVKLSSLFKLISRAQVLDSGTGTDLASSGMARAQATAFCQTKKECSASGVAQREYRC